MHYIRSLFATAGCFRNSYPKSTALVDGDMHPRKKSRGTFSYLKALPPRSTCCQSYSCSASCCPPTSLKERKSRPSTSRTSHAVQSASKFFPRKFHPATAWVVACKSGRHSQGAIDLTHCSCSSAAGRPGACSSLSDITYQPVTDSRWRRNVLIFRPGCVLFNVTDARFVSVQCRLFRANPNSEGQTSSRLPQSAFQQTLLP